MPSPNLHLTFRDGGTGDAGDQYTGLDRFGRLVETLWKQDTGDRVRSKYGRNRVGGVVWRRDEEAHAQGKNTQDNYYKYDGLQQVRQRQRGDLTGPAPDYTGVTNLQQKEDWTHDAAGNWAACSNTSPTNAQTRTHNPANEITEISAAPGDVEPAYDPVGNMLTLPKEPGTSTEQYDLVWDAWNRLVAVKDGGTVLASYTYDGLTRRLTKTNAAETRHYYYNNQWRSVEERMNDGSTIDRQFTWGLRDRWDLVRRKRSVSGSLDDTLFLLRDYLDPVAIMNESGAVVERYAYDAFGNVRFLAPDYTSKSGSDFDWEFLFHAEFRDSDTELYNYGYRYYDTGLGRWPSKDPIEEQAGTNLYAATANDLVNAIDIFGLLVPMWRPVPFEPWRIVPEPNPGFNAGGLPPSPPPGRPIYPSDEPPYPDPSPNPPSSGPSVGPAPVQVPTNEREAKQLCPCLPNGRGSINYYHLDAWNRATGVTGRITLGWTHGKGKRVPENLTPAGFDELNVLLRKYSSGTDFAAKAHLWGQLNGGDGTKRENVVPMVHNAVNNSSMKSFERAVFMKMQDGDTLCFYSKPNYAYGIMPPASVTVFAWSSKGWLRNETFQTAPFSLLALSQYNSWRSR